MGPTYTAAYVWRDTRTEDGDAAVLDGTRALMELLPLPPGLEPAAAAPHADPELTDSTAERRCRGGQPVRQLRAETLLTPR